MTGTALTKFQEAVKLYQELRFLHEDKRYYNINAKYLSLRYFPEKTAMNHDSALAIVKERGLPWRNISEGEHHPYPDYRFKTRGVL